MATRPEFKAGQFAVKNRPVISVMCGAVFTAAAGVVYAGSDEPVFSEEVIHPSISAKSLANDNKDTPLLQGRMSIEEGCYEHDILGRDCSGAVGKLKAHAKRTDFLEQLIWIVKSMKVILLSNHPSKSYLPVIVWARKTAHISL